MKKNIVILLLVFFVFSALKPLTAEAQTSGPQTQSIFADSAGCVAGGFLGGIVANLAIKGLNALRGLLPDRIKSWFGLEDEVPIHDLKDWTKQNVRDLIARCGARAILNNMTGRMIGAVRTSGRNCRAGLPCPSFVQNWRKFLAGGQYRGENIFRSMLKSTFICPHYSRELKGIYNALYQPNLGQTPTRFGNLDPYGSRSSCTMPSGWTLANYQLNFIANGGWGALTRLAEPQNNFYGSLLMSQGELQTQRSQGQTEDIIEAITGAGMTSRRSDNPATRANRSGFCSNAATVRCTNNATCTALPDNAGTGKVCIIPRDSCLIRDPLNTQCLLYNDIITPGRVLGDSVSAVINNEMGWITGIHEMEELMSNLTRLLMNRILNLSRPDVDQQEGFPGEIYPPFDDDPDIDPNLIPDPLPPPGSGGACVGTGSARYETELGTAMATVIANNPGGIADQPNTQTNTFIFFGYVITELQNMGLQGTSSVLNGNDNPNSGDLIAVWSSGDTAMDRYDAIIALGSGTLIRFSTTTQFNGQVPISSCTDSGAFAVTVWSGPNLSGTWESFTSGDSALANNLIGDNNIESIQVPAGMSADLCDGIDFGPPCETFTADDFDLSNNTVIGANTASSIRVPSGGGVGPPECSDGLDNDSDVGLPRGGIDFPNDAGCLSTTDNDEVEYVVSLCRGANNGSPCESFSADDPDLSDNTGINVVGDNQASSFVAGGITTGRLVVEFCDGVNFTGCVSITTGSDPDFSDGIPVPDNSISSIRVQQQ